MTDVKRNQEYQFSYHGFQSAHKIQLLTYSCNAQRAVEVELSLKSKRDSEKEKRARQSTFSARHNTTQYYKHTLVHQRVQTLVNREAGVTADLDPTGPNPLAEPTGHF